MYYLYIYKLDDKYPPKEREIRIFTIAKQGQYLDTYIGEFDSYGQAFSAGEKIVKEKKKLSDIANPQVVRVVNLSTREELLYTCSPSQATIAAYAQERGDYNTWDYQKKYGHLVEESTHTFLCGDWCAVKLLEEEPS